MQRNCAAHQLCHVSCIQSTIVIGNWIFVIFEWFRKKNKKLPPVSKCWAETTQNANKLCSLGMNWFEKFKV